MAAKTRGDLAGLFDDLPDAGSLRGPGGPGPARLRPRTPGRGAARGGLPLAASCWRSSSCSARTAWHAMNSFFFFNIPWFPIAVIVAIVLLVTRHHRR